MEPFDRRAHWEQVYESKPLTEVSWYQPLPATSIRLIEAAAPAKDAAIIDIGGGDSFLTDSLLEKGYTKLHVLDISGAALERARTRLGSRAGRVRWIHADVTRFRPEQAYACWHDRAAFHFLTDPAEIGAYAGTAARSILPGGGLIVGTFSDSGPLKCSGIPVQRYSGEQLQAVFAVDFELLETFSEEHPTPFNTMQSFVFARFRRR